MRVWTLSDLHVDVHPWQPPVDVREHDVIVVAGDVSEGLVGRALPWLWDHLGGGAPIVYVPGNHDFWRTVLQREVVAARELAGELGIHLLAEGESVILGGTRFVGATLWTDYGIRPDARAAALGAAGDRQTGMRDHRRITNLHGGSYNALRPTGCARLHAAHRARIEQVLAEPHDGPTVVVTHHAPHERSLLHAEWREFLDGAYASDLSGILEGVNAPDLWVHGHVHVNRDYRVGGTRVVANPRGYVSVERGQRGRPDTVRAENPAFDPTLVLEV